MIKTAEQILTETYNRYGWEVYGNETWDVMINAMEKYANQFKNDDSQKSSVIDCISQDAKRRLLESFASKIDHNGYTIPKQEIPYLVKTYMDSYCNFI